MPKKARLTAEMWAARRLESKERQKLAKKRWRDENPPETRRLPAARLDAQTRRIEPSPFLLLPLLPRPHPLAGLLFTEIPVGHPARDKTQRGTILVWQLSTYARDVHTSYQAWARIESAQWLASPLIFPTRLLARRFLAIRRNAACPDTPTTERGSSGKVHWAPECLDAILPDHLTPFGDAIRASPI